MKPVISDHKERNYLPLLTTIVLFLQVGLIGSALLQWMTLLRIGQHRGAYSIHTTTGEVYPLRPIDPRLRPPEVVQAFTIQALMLLFNWQGAQQNTYGELEPDRGVEVDIGDGERVRVPTTVAESSFVIQAGFQEAMLRRIAEIVPRDYFNGSVEVLLVLNAVTLPEESEDGIYHITVVGHRYSVRNGKYPGDREPFNKRITLRRTEIPFVPTGETALEQTIYKVRQAGLIITDIQEFKEDNSDV